MINRHAEQRETGNDLKTVVLFKGQELMRTYRGELHPGDRLDIQREGFIVDNVEYGTLEQVVSVRVEV